MKVFLINLDKDRERLNFADKQLQNAGVSYERISAVYGKNLSQDEKKSAISSLRSWCAIGRGLRDGEIGCAMSHYKIYKKMLDEDLSIACVLEDDVMVSPQFKTQLDFVSANIDISRPQVILLSNHTAETSTKQEVRKAKNDMFAEGYFITKKAAALLLKANFPMIVPCDHWGRWVRCNRLELFHAFPTVCSQNKQDFDSNTIAPAIVSVKQMSAIRWTAHKATRILGCSIDRIMTLLTHR